VKKLTVILVSIALLAGLSAGFVIGARVGVDEFLYADAQYKAAILAWQLDALQAKKDGPVITQMETALNAELARHGRYMESRLTWLWPDMRAADDRPIGEAVDYRIAHPFEEPDEFAPEPIQKQYRNKVIEHYRNRELVRQR